MVKLLSSDIARLVLAYLQEENLTGSARKFLQESPHLEELRENPDCPALPPNAKGLKSVLDEYGAFANEARKKINSKPIVSGLWRKLESLTNQLKYEYIYSEGESAPAKTGRAKSINQRVKARYALESLKSRQFEKHRAAEVDASLQDSPSNDVASSSSPLDQSCSSSVGLVTPTKQDVPGSSTQSQSRPSPKRKSSLPKRKVPSPGQDGPHHIPLEDVQELPGIVECLMQDASFHEKLAVSINKVVPISRESPTPATGDKLQTPQKGTPTSNKSDAADRSSTLSLSDVFMDDLVNKQNLHELYETVSSDPAYDNLFTMFNVDREQFWADEKKRSLEDEDINPGTTSPKGIQTEMEVESVQDDDDDDRYTPTPPLPMVECETPQTAKKEVKRRRRKNFQDAPTRRSTRIKKKPEPAKTHKESSRPSSTGTSRKMSAEDKEKMEKRNEIAKLWLKKMSGSAALGENVYTRHQKTVNIGGINVGVNQSNPAVNLEATTSTCNSSQVSSVNLPYVIGSSTPTSLGQTSFVKQAKGSSNVIYLPANTHLIPASRTVVVTTGSGATYSSGTTPVLSSTQRTVSSMAPVQNPLANRTVERDQNSNYQSVWTFNLPGQDTSYIIQTDGSAQQFLPNVINQNYQLQPNVSVNQNMVITNGLNLPHVVSYGDGTVMRPVQDFASHPVVMNSLIIPTDQRCNVSLPNPSSDTGRATHTLPVTNSPLQRTSHIGTCTGTNFVRDNISGNSAHLSFVGVNASDCVHGSSGTFSRVNVETITSDSTESFNSLVRREEQRIQEAIAIDDNLPEVIVTTSTDCTDFSTSYPEDLEPHLENANTQDINFAIQQLKFTPPRSQIRTPENEPSPIETFIAASLRKCVFDSTQGKSSEKAMQEQSAVPKTSPWKKAALMLSPQKNKCVRKVRFEDGGDNDFLHPETALGLNKEVVQIMEKEVLGMGILPRRGSSSVSPRFSSASPRSSATTPQSGSGFVRIDNSTTRIQSRVKVGEIVEGGKINESVDGSTGNKKDGDTQGNKIFDNNGACSPVSITNVKRTESVSSATYKKSLTGRKKNSCSSVSVNDIERIRKLERRFSGASKFVEKPVNSPSNSNSQTLKNSPQKQNKKYEDNLEREVLAVERSVSVKEKDVVRSPASVSLYPNNQAREGAVVDRPSTCDQEKMSPKKKQGFEPSKRGIVDKRTDSMDESEGDVDETRGIVDQNRNSEDETLGDTDIVRERAENEGDGQAEVRGNEAVQRDNGDESGSSGGRIGITSESGVMEDESTNANRKRVENGKSRGDERMDSTDGADRMVGNLDERQGSVNERSGSGDERQSRADASNEAEEGIHPDDAHERCKDLSQEVGAHPSTGASDAEEGPCRVASLESPTADILSPAAISRVSETEQFPLSEGANSNRQKPQKRSSNSQGNNVEVPLESHSESNASRVSHCTNLHKDTSSKDEASVGELEAPNTCASRSATGAEGETTMQLISKTPNMSPKAAVPPKTVDGDNSPNDNLHLLSSQEEQSDSGKLKISNASVSDLFVELGKNAAPGGGSAEVALQSKSNSSAADLSERPGVSSSDKTLPVISTSQKLLDQLQEVEKSSRIPEKFLKDRLRENCSPSSNLQIISGGKKSLQEVNTSFGGTSSRKGNCSPTPSREPSVSGDGAVANAKEQEKLNGVIVAFNESPCSMMPVYKNNDVNISIRRRKDDFVDSGCSEGEHSLRSLHVTIPLINLDSKGLSSIKLLSKDTQLSEKSSRNPIVLVREHQEKPAEMYTELKKRSVPQDVDIDETKLKVGGTRAIDILSAVCVKESEKVSVNGISEIKETISRTHLDAKETSLEKRKGRSDKGRADERKMKHAIREKIKRADNELPAAVQNGVMADVVCNGHAEASIEGKQKKRKRKRIRRENSSDDQTQKKLKKSQRKLSVFPLDLDIGTFLSKLHPE